MSDIKQAKPTRDIIKALQHFTESDQEWTWVGMELYYSLSQVTKHRFELVINEYQKQKEIMR